MKNSLNLSLTFIVQAVAHLIPGITDEKVNAVIPLPSGKGYEIETDIRGYETVRIDFKYSPVTDREEVVYFSDGTNEHTYEMPIPVDDLELAEQ